MVFESLSAGEKMSMKVAKSGQPVMSEFQKFNALAKALVQVPKHEVDALLAKERKKKARAKNGRASHKQAKK
jgi:hypothetical protein